MDTQTQDILEIRDRGQFLQLTDGSVFRVDPFDLPEVRTWSTANEIELSKTRDRIFNYTLTNQDNFSWIRAIKLN